jgi:hypothetical protein
VLLAIAWCTAPTVAGAAEYEVFIDIETEEDLYDLQVTEQISDETFETLRELYQRGVDLNEANRAELYTLPNLTYAEVDAILRYREEAGGITDPAALVMNGVLGGDKLAAIAPFLIVRSPTRSSLAADGWLRAQTRWSAEDGEDVPPPALQARVDTLRHLRLGAAATVTRARLGEVVYDPNRDALSAESPSTQAHVPKAFAMWETDRVAVIVGTYRIGFGQRLTFDVTDQLSPNGLYEDDELFRDTDLVRECKESSGELGMTPCPEGEDQPGSQFITPDFRWRDSLLGVAAGLKQIPIGRGWAQTYGFFSYQPKSIYQYELYDRSLCSDPRDDENMLPGNVDCGAPDVFRTRDNVFEPTSRFSFQTLPDMYAELTAGGNVTYHHNRRTHVGFTGYGARANFLTEGIDLDFQEWSRTPFGGPWGAIGADVAYGYRTTDLFLEVTRALDQELDGGGGWGGVFRSVTSWNRQEIEGSLRYYDQDFTNPYARPIAAPDEFDGLRARDEAGARLRYSGRFARKISLRTSGDVWYSPSEDSTDALVYARADGDVNDQLRVGGSLQYQDKVIGTGGRDQCFEVSIEEDEDGEAVPCAGHKIQITRCA